MDNAESSANANSVCKLFFAWKRRELFQLIRCTQRSEKKNNSENCCSSGGTERNNQQTAMQDNELLIFLREKQNATKEESSSKLGGPLLPPLFVWAKTNKTSPKLRVENLNWTLLSARFSVQEPYVKSGSAVRLQCFSLCVRKTRANRVQVVSKRSPLPSLTVLALSLPSDCVCCVLCLSAGLLRLTCK